MAIPLGYLGGKPIQGPPRPLFECSPTIDSNNRQPKSNCGLFGKLPRELRDIIFKNALVYPFSKLIERLDDGVRMKSLFYGLDMETQYIYLGKLSFLSSPQPATLTVPPGMEQLKHRMQNQAIYLANKQLRVEAIETFYSVNTFAICIDTGLPSYLIQYSDDPSSSPFPNTTHWPSKKHFGLIKRLVIDIPNSVPLWDPHYIEHTELLRQRLEDVVRLLREAGNHLQSLRVIYHETLHGDIGKALSDKNTATRDQEDITIMVDPALNQWNLERDIDNHITWRRSLPLPPQTFRTPNVLEPLIHLRGHINNLEIRGDFPHSYIRAILLAVFSDPDKPGHNVTTAQKVEVALVDEYFDSRPKRFPRFSSLFSQAYPGAVGPHLPPTTLSISLLTYVRSQINTRIPEIMDELFSTAPTEHWLRVQENGSLLPPGVREDEDWVKLGK